MRFSFHVKKNDTPDLSRILNHIKTLRQGLYTVEIERVRAKRSLPQNAFWHGVWLPIIADSLGYLDPEEACRAVKIKLGYCTVQTDKITAGKRWVCRSTADMNVVDMALFLEKVEILAAEFDIRLPSRNQEEP